MKPEAKHTLYLGTVMHSRVSPVKHQFTYPAFAVCMSLRDLDNNTPSTLWFGHNKHRFFSLFDKDYLFNDQRSILEKLQQLLSQHGYEAALSGDVFLITVPKVFGYVFNPVSFYYCYDRSGQLEVVVAEVNNTYNERHIYLCSPTSSDENKSSSIGLSSQLEKTFFVSPFNNMQGNYKFYTNGLMDEKLTVKFDLYRKEQAVLFTQMTLQAKPWSSKNLCSLLLRMPLSAAMIFPRISWQALKLKRKGMTTLLKPTPNHDMTIRKNDSFWHRSFLYLHHRFHKKNR